MTAFFGSKDWIIFHTLPQLELISFDIVVDIVINPIQDEHLWECSMMGGPRKKTPSLKSVKDILQ